MDMDSVREFSDGDVVTFLEDGDDIAPGGVESPLIVDVDERRMQVRAYHHWASLLNGRDLPSIEDLEPKDLVDFGPHSVLMDFTAGAETPVVAYLGGALRSACGLDGIPLQSVADVPGGSLLSRLTDHYLQIIANRAPVGFEAEFRTRDGVDTLYRGILMPYSSDGDTIDFVYGVINWKELADSGLEEGLAREMDAAMPDPAGGLVLNRSDDPQTSTTAHVFVADQGADDDTVPALPPMIHDSGLGDLLAAARQGADAVRIADGRSRAALYRALGLAYDFALVSEARAGEYADLLDDAGLKVQARAPMTPIVKLVFGIDYDKTRLTEFAAALAHARRMGLGVAQLAGYLESHPGGLKAVVRAERQARAPEGRTAPVEEAVAQLRRMPPRAIVQMDPGDDEFVLLVARRVSETGLAVLGSVQDESLVARAVRVAGK
ncbi:hypothetical protein [Sphingomonas sp. C3-2]|uniref:hypothetical protein n=1 Tax=Sphingomonas sp. C3-2 TaxID=3062169 RepID=UPI00294B8DFF|nr:hypothetical protein [Sphingomonas sp. C3-2]WOK35402.1 hypothetical protein QYC26_10225 [Sphingomonas sp. C3-2]